MGSESEADTPGCAQGGPGAQLLWLLWGCVCLSPTPKCQDGGDAESQQSPGEVGARPWGPTTGHRCGEEVQLAGAEALAVVS